MKSWLSCLAGSTVLVGCQAVPHAPVIYASDWSVGLVAEQAASDPSPTINLGVQIADAAWVPAITCTELTSEGKAPQTGCISRKVFADDRNQSLEDAFSVFGTFNSRSSVTEHAAASDGKAAVPLGASVTAGKVFSTGLAAVHIASASGPAHYRVCIESVSRDIDVSTKLADLNNVLAVCNVKAYEKPK